MTRGNTNLAIFLFAVVATLGVLLVTMGAQTPNLELAKTAPAESHSVWDGVYTQKQAQRGEAIYDQQCSSCHGEKLTGKESEDSPALTGRDFDNEWKGRTVGDMFRKILRKMPQDNPGHLTAQQSADLVAFILSFNAFPAGKTELPPQNEALVGIRFDEKKPEQK
ncbi:MAG TPA: c-type cytochrome [Candidatus Angelobacter sp.]